MLSHITLCYAIVSTGQKSFSALTDDYGVAVPEMGKYNTFRLANRDIRLLHMPSFSRAYPMKPVAKAAYYRHLMQEVEIMEKNL